MRISELSRTTGVSVPTIKYYIRQGLLPRGDRTAYNQARYSFFHIDRLRLIRTLREVADLPVATIAEVVTALEEPAAAARAEHISKALGSLRRGERPAPSGTQSTVADLVRRLGWRVDPSSGAYQDLAAALASLEEYWKYGYTLEGLEGYAQVAEELAQMEIPEDWQPTDEDALSYAVLGTVLFEPIILSLRRMAHEDRHRRLTDPETNSDS